MMVMDDKPGLFQSWRPVITLTLLAAFALALLFAYGCKSEPEPAYMQQEINSINSTLSDINASIQNINDFDIMLLTGQLNPPPDSAAAPMIEGGGGGSGLQKDFDCPVSFTARDGSLAEIDMQFMSDGKLQCSYVRLHHLAEEGQP